MTDQASKTFESFARELEFIRDHPRTVLQVLSYYNFLLLLRSEGDLFDEFIEKYNTALSGKSAVCHAQTDCCKISAMSLLLGKDPCCYGSNLLRESMHNGLGSFLTFAMHPVPSSLVPIKGVTMLDQHQSSKFLSYILIYIYTKTEFKVVHGYISGGGNSLMFQIPKSAIRGGLFLDPKGPESDDVVGYTYFPTNRANLILPATATLIRMSLPLFSEKGGSLECSVDEMPLQSDALRNQEPLRSARDKKMDKLFSPDNYPQSLLSCNSLSAKPTVTKVSEFENNVLTRSYPTSQCQSVLPKLSVAIGTNSLPLSHKHSDSPIVSYPTPTYTNVAATATVPSTYAITGGIPPAQYIRPIRHSPVVFPFNPAVPSFVPRVPTLPLPQISPSYYPTPTFRMINPNLPTDFYKNPDSPFFKDFVSP